jgi:hypothetical protein
MVLAQGHDPDEMQEGGVRWAGDCIYARAALRSVKPSDISDEMLSVARIRLGFDSFDLDDETLRRAISAAIAAGA